MKAPSAEPPFSASPKTYVERIAPALPSHIYMLTPGDVHLGANNRSGALIEMLSHTDCGLLVLNGDFLETSDVKHLLKRLVPRDRDLIRLIEKKRLAGTRVVYVKGNHDEDVLTLLAHIAQITESERSAYSADKQDILNTLSLLRNWEIVEQFSHEYRDTKFVHIHGDQWDHIVRGKWFGRLLAHVGGFFWDILKQIDREKQYIARFVKRQVKIVTHVSNQVAQGAVALAKDHGARYAFAGHTHDPLQFSAGTVEYVNAGGFDMYESGIASIDMEGNVLLHRVRARSKQIKKVVS